MHSFEDFVVVFFLFLKGCLAFPEAEISLDKVDAKPTSEVVKLISYFLLDLRYVDDISINFEVFV